MYNISKENESVEILKLNHECKYLKYEPEKLFNFKKFVLSPDFKIQTEMKYGIERKTLIIFDENDATMCHIYNFVPSDNMFKCNKCLKKHVFVWAKLKQNSDGENYVILSNAQHICESVKYVPKKDDDIIIRPPNIKVMERTLSGVAKVFIFDSTDKNLCYVFTNNNGKTQYKCRDCKDVKRKTKNKLDKIVTIYLCKNENEEYYAQMENQKHLCQPKKYDPKKYEAVEPSIADKFFYYRKKSYPKSLYVAIYHPTDSTLCYTFFSTSTNFRCPNCWKLKKGKSYHIPFPKTDESGKEYFIHHIQKHSCKPIKISSIQTSKFQRLERKDITLKEESKKNQMKVDEKRILKLPNFEFRENRKGDP
uniref:Uncharacterized protein n=1 Tax=Panagrolaimus sp. PS1159 TaxID=55785 RepID=A0AC35FKR3_9BILA